MTTENFVTFEMNQIGGSVVFSTSSPNPYALSVGDTWSLTIQNGPKNAALMELVNGWSYPPQYQTVAMTNAQGNVTYSGAATAAQNGTEAYIVFTMLFPNTYPGYQDPNAPAGYRNVCIAIVAFTVGVAAS